MTVFAAGSGIKEIYVNGSKIASAYSYGVPVFSKKAGWQEAGTMTLTINPANSNSVSGTIIYKIFEHVQGSTVTDRYYERSVVSLTRLNEGCVTLNFGADSVFYLGDENTSAEYFFPSNGTITMSATELAKVYRFKKHSSIMDLGSAKTVTSNYIFQTQGMTVSASGTNLTIGTGWTISQNNRACSIYNKTTATYSLEALNVPADGTWPVYAVAGSGTENVMIQLTAAPNVYQNYENVRLLGLVTVYGGAITNFENINHIALPTSATMSKSISGSTLTVGAGYAVDTDGLMVYVPTSSYQFNDMVSAAADKHVPETLGVSKTEISESASSVSAVKTMTMWSSGSSHFNKVATTNQRARLTFILRNTAVITKSYTLQFSRYQGTNYSTPHAVTIASSQTSKGQKVYAVWDMPTNSTLYNIEGTTNLSSSVKGNVLKELKYAYITQEAHTTPGTAQSRVLYAKVSRNQDTGVVTYSATQTTGPSSTPYVSYILLGTLTVPRNSFTGSIT